MRVWLQEEKWVTFSWPSDNVLRAHFCTLFWISNATPLYAQTRQLRIVLYWSAPNVITVVKPVVALLTLNVSLATLLIWETNPQVEVNVIVRVHTLTMESQCVSYAQISCHIAVYARLKLLVLLALTEVLCQKQTVLDAYAIPLISLTLCPPALSVRLSLDAQLPPKILTSRAAPNVTKPSTSTNFPHPIVLVWQITNPVLTKQNVLTFVETA